MCKDQLAAPLEDGAAIWFGSDLFETVVHVFDDDLRGFIGRQLAIGEFFQGRLEDITHFRILVIRGHGRAGYLDPLYFSRLFKRLIGTSPSAYRSASTINPELVEPNSDHPQETKGIVVNAD